MYQKSSKIDHEYSVLHFRSCKGTGKKKVTQERWGFDQ